MPLKKVISNPHRFPERFLFFGDGGAGKSTAVLSLARHMPDSKFDIVDTDISFAYDRLLALEFQDVEEQGNVEIKQAVDWQEFCDATDYFDKDRDGKDNFLVVDNGTFPWQWVQEYHIKVTYGEDIDEFLARIRRETAGDKEPAKAYAKMVADLMQWPIINKRFVQGFYRHYQKWRGHGIICTEERDLKGEKDADILSQFQYYGAAPKGQGDLPYAMATNVRLYSAGKDKWKFSTTKDRGRPKVDKVDVTDFALDFLVDIAGWDVERRRV